MDYPKDAWELLSPRFTDTRRQRMLDVVKKRTEHIRLVVQDIHHPHNVSACIRTAEACGIQQNDVVTLKESFKPSTVARGVANWLTINRFYEIKDCIQELRAGGYKIVAGVPRPDAASLYEIPVDQPLAVVFGNEHAGIDNAWLDEIDYPFTIPMVGMVESLNISVSAAVTLHHLTKKSRDTVGDKYLISDEKQKALLNEWACKAVRSYEKELDSLRGNLNH
jgi:tRNA (guanosine-2'-O-)-methyltransferase